MPSSSVQKAMSMDLLEISPFPNALRCFDGIKMPGAISPGPIRKGSMDCSPSKLRSSMRHTGTHGTRVFHHAIEFPVVCFIAGPSQDLLILIERHSLPSTANQDPPYRIHLRTLSTNHPHPRANIPVIEHVMPLRNTIHELHIQVMGNIIGVYFKVRSGNGDGPPRPLSLFSCGSGRLVPSKLA
ncbi:hypothetical protein BOTBODRAFT_37116 [Botryobasidium botryosum FD-172 SS1]|uniref:Uncharacterized protein n=1 Tax=Botryobasidium botryosum (strain FD-172 SS1) TaxID=930990 RepID=A0A067M1F0_BOTB1|nr:hypothetical protein BOTBODRAFT_37116 [Botryobasidium botryosum FD-172 SS1]